MAVGVMWLGLTVGVVARRRRPPARPCRARPTAPCSRLTTSGTRPSRACRSTRTARPGCRAWTPSTTNLHPDFGPSGDPSNPYGMPYTVVSRHSPRCRITFQYAGESDPGPYPFSATRRSKAVSSRPATATPSWSTRPRARSTSSTTRSTALGLDGRFGRHLEPQLERAAPGRVDVGRRRRPADPAGARALRRGAVGRHHPRHPHDGRGDRHLVPVAGPSRGRDVVATRTCRPWGPASGSRPSYNISGYSPQAQVVLRAMQQYGLILADNGSNWYFGGTADDSWPARSSTSSKRSRPAPSRRSTSRR